jgi:hypothetical protein
MMFGFGLNPREPCLFQNGTSIHTAFTLLP